MDFLEKWPISLVVTKKVTMLNHKWCNLMRNAIMKKKKMMNSKWEECLEMQR